MNQIGHCMACDHRFSVHEAEQKDLIAYRLRGQYLNPAQLIPSLSQAEPNGTVVR